MVDEVQSPGASLAMAVIVSEVVFFGTLVVAFEPVTLIAALAVAAPFFSTISVEFLRAFWWFGRSGDGAQ
jgi:hypothetical protein